VLHGEIASDKPAAAVDQSKQQLQFFRDTKKYLTSLAARIDQLRKITQSNSEHMRRHGTAELIQTRNPSDPATSGEAIDEASENGIMARLQAEFTNVHKKLENLEILATAVRLGPRGPQDKEYSDAWVEASLHEYEKKEFEETAVRMGYPANSVTMDPVISEEDQKELTKLTDKFYDYTSRIGVGGEYKDIGSDPGENLPFPLNLAGRYSGNSGLNQFQKSQRVFMLGQTFHKMGIELEDPLMRKRDEEHETEEESEEEQSLEDEEAGPVEHEETAVEGLEDDTMFTDGPLVVEPGEKISSEYTKIFNQLRKSMSDVDRDLSSLEDNYDTFLKHHASETPIIPSQTPSQEATI
jgi:hypothetical protein